MRAARFGCFVAFGIAALLPGAAAFACSDSDRTPSSRWSIGRLATGPVLLTPCGEPFFSIGVNAVSGGDLEDFERNPHAYWWARFASSRSTWAKSARWRLSEWGFNTAGAWSLPPAEIGLPSTPELDLGRGVQFVWGDPFDPAMAARVQHLAKQAVARFRGDPLRIGYFSDNEIGWWNGSLFLVYMAAAPENHTKRRLLALLREHYHDDWRAFTRDFVPPRGTISFADLLAKRSSPHLRPGSQGIDLVRAWTRVFTTRYYSVMREALRTADPDALYLGDRLPIYYDPDAIRAMAPYVDVISVNYNVDAPDGWIAPYFFQGLRDLSGGKPVLITEWFYAAAKNRSGNLNRTGPPHRGAKAPISHNRNLTGHLMTVLTQAERARGAGRAARLLAEAPNVVGVHWFQYADEPPGGRADGEDYDFGLVDVDDRPYQRLVDALREANRLAQARVGAATIAPPPAAAEIMLPNANIDVASESLAGWPKSASLLPLKPAPGEAVFGDVYLVWNERGLFLATISMDYYDPGLLLAPTATFPRSEAFRIALGVDAGTGPNRIELRVVPTKLLHAAGKETRLRFEVETCRYADTDSCAPVPGAMAHYFGTALDQPRIILNAFIPWSQLGLSRLPVTDTVRLQLGVTAFYRSKWMSSNGLSPEIALARPETWLPARLLPAVPKDRLLERSANTAAEPPN